MPHDHAQTRFGMQDLHRTDPSAGLLYLTLPAGWGGVQHRSPVFGRLRQSTLTWFLHDEQSRDAPGKGKSHE
jgi:hypothetical protein